MRLFRLALQILWILLLAAIAASPEQPNPMARRLKIEAQDTTSVSYVSMLLREAGLWGGIESYSRTCDADVRVRVPPLSGTVADGLSQLGSRDKSLSWHTPS